MQNITILGGEIGVKVKAKCTGCDVTEWLDVEEEIGEAEPGKTFKYFCPACQTEALFEVLE